MNLPFPPEEIVRLLREGAVIPAHPLALNSRRRLDERRQRALTRYYCAAGVGGVAIGVHTTQFDIRKPEVGLYEPVLALTAETLNAAEKAGKPRFIRVAGVCGSTPQAVDEAQLAFDLGYHLGLISLGGLTEWSNSRLIEHLRAVAEVIPIFGFYLQPAVGGRILDVQFWRQAVEIQNLLAIKIAPFNRYQTLDVVRAVAEAGRTLEIALYTGNDDNIVFDLLSEFQFSKDQALPLRIVGGLLGQWAVWAQKAVAMLDDIKAIRGQANHVPGRLFRLANQLTDANAAIFDARNQFRGCIPGIHEILSRQGLLENVLTLDPHHGLSPSQQDEIVRVCQAYPHLSDDQFVQGHLDDWLS